MVGVYNIILYYIRLIKDKNCVWVKILHENLQTCKQSLIGETLSFESDELHVTVPIKH